MTTLTRLWLFLSFLWIAAMVLSNTGPLDIAILELALVPPVLGLGAIWVIGGFQRR